MKKLDSLDLLVRGKQYTGQKGRDLNVTRTKFLEEINSRRISTGGMYVFEKTGGKMIRNEVGDLYFRVRSKLPACESFELSLS